MADSVGVLDQSGTGTKPVHTEPAQSQKSDGTPFEQQVVQIESERAVDVLISVLQSIDSRLAALQEHFMGYSTE